MSRRASGLRVRVEREDAPVWRGRGREFCVRTMTGLGLALLLVGGGQCADFYVATNGADRADGTREKPLATLAAARDAARRSGGGGHRIRLLPGEYFLEEPLTLDARDNGLTVEAEGAGRVTVYGGRRVTGWHRDGEKFWCADLPEVKSGAWDFRALVVNGRMPDRARMPESGFFTHQNVFNAKWLSSVGGGWERKPTHADLTTLVYHPTNLPPSLEVRNAELRVYHMWDDSLVGVASNDVARHTLHFTSPAGHPAGAFGVKKYVVFNTREGMTRPGQWYLDRAAGRLVYWPLAGERMESASVIAPTLTSVIRLRGSAKAPVERVTLRGFSVQATTTPLKPGGFSAHAYDGAVELYHAKECALIGMEICHVGGQGVKSWALDACRIEACHIHHVGACGIRTGGDASVIEGNHIHHAGVYQPSAVALQFGRVRRDSKLSGFHIRRNEIHDAPYSGMTGGGSDHLIEENLIYRVMRELHDGAAIYGSMSRTVLRGNVVRDVVEIGQGYGASAYYFDEGATGNVVERNVAIGVPMPTHNHITTGVTIRDNVFVSDGDMKLSFPRSRDCVFTGNTLYAPGKVTVTAPNAVTSWVGNVLFSGNAQGGSTPAAFTITDAMPPAPAPARRTWAVAVPRTEQPPVMDGEIGDGEWAGSFVNIDRDPSRWLASGAPAFIKLMYDEQYLYVAANTVLFDIGLLSKGDRWGQDDGAELCIAGAKGIAVIRGFAGGACVSVTDAGLPSEEAERLGKAVRFAAKPYGKTRNDWKSGWRGEWAIPFKELGIRPEPGMKVAFNYGLFRAEDKVWRSLEGTGAANWRLSEAALLQFK